MTGRGTANVLTRTTAALAIGFFATSLALSWLAGLGRHPASIINSGTPATQQAPGSAPEVPLSQSGRGVLDQLRGQGPAAPAPGGPQVPQSK
jgi:preprotein translocase subunit SecG